MEIAEAFDLNQTQIDSAAQNLMLSNPKKYIEHMGEGNWQNHIWVYIDLGMSASEVQDFNQYSQQGLFKQHNTDDQYPSDYELSDRANDGSAGDDMLLVTSL